ncbi:MAG TPA: energy transducer TonB [Dokdonella sp.]|uniref:energy transducer TonB n=1 Tax=Dokdonella sp. TaxID=2291710 RepID=UPI002BFC28CC|nr:energy transducer TonB [Dokdonella sp.]HUD42631.1 energy transducer TonB [Dokdonella sp.]
MTNQCHRVLFPRSAGPRPLILGALFVATLMLAACGESPAPTTPAAPAAQPAAPATPTATPDAPAAPAAAPTAFDTLSVDDLFQRANEAVSDNRIAAPVGNNAVEYYLAILAREPNRDGARDGLRELFPFATGVVEQAINRGDVDEAERVIDLLARADSNNYSLTILRSKLDVRRRQVEREAAAQTAQQAAQAAAAAQASRPPATPAPQRPEPAAPTADTRPATPSPAATPAPPPAPAATPPPSPPPPVGETRDAGIVSSASPDYPARAYRDRQEGWVEVEFTVTPDGSPSGVRVVRSNPPRVFDREAIQAIERSTFRPRLENGVAVSSTLRRRIEFTMGN